MINVRRTVNKTGTNVKRIRLARRPIGFDHKSKPPPAGLTRGPRSLVVIKRKEDMDAHETKFGQGELGE